MPTRLRLLLVLLFSIFVGSVMGARLENPFLGFLAANLVAAGWLAQERGWVLGVNSQVGRQLRTQRPPTFAHYTVAGGTWEEADATMVDRQKNGDEETFNLTAIDRGFDYKCDLMPDVGYDLNVLDVITETGVDNPRSFTVVDPLVKKNFGKRALKYGVSLLTRDALDTTQVS